MNKKEYENLFMGNPPQDGQKKSKAEMALEIAMDIRKFEIDLYWKRATYFWTFIAAAFAGYALVFTKMDVDHFHEKSWILLVFSCLGLLFSIAWYLVNRGSKFWQNNWERHVDLLENEVIGPLYKTIAHSKDGCNPLTTEKPYSVSKINQILSFFVSCFWVVLIAKSILPISACNVIDWYKVSVLVITFATIGCLIIYGKSQIEETETKLTSRMVTILAKE